jgi:hypothetical protein
MLKILIFLFFALLHAASSAESYGPFKLIESKPVNEIWLNPGFYSYHFQKDRNLNGDNIGAGVEYRYSTVNSITAGWFHNSDWQISHYAAWYWQPFALGSVRLGALLGVVDGYPKANNGGWFPLALPVASFEYKNIGINITIVPTYREVLHGSVSLQLKLKVF